MKKLSNSGHMLPCPFCGSDGVGASTVIDQFDVETHGVCCAGCGAQIESKESMMCAVAAWNARRHQEWRPIKAAQKDGRLVLCCRTTSIVPYVAAYYQNYGWVDTSGSHRDPSHWMPLPEVPR